MPLKLATPVSTQVLTLQEVKDRLKITDTSQDSVITSLITELRSACQKKTHYAIGAQSWVLALDAFPEQIQLAYPPLIAITSIQYYDPDGVLQTLPTNQYAIDDFNEPGWIVPASGVTWPSVDDTINAVRVTFQCGYVAANLPESLKLWMLANIGHFERNREVFSADDNGQCTIVDGLLDGNRLWIA